MKLSRTKTTITITLNRREAEHVGRALLLYHEARMHLRRFREERKNALIKTMDDLEDELHAMWWVPTKELKHTEYTY
jgi:hypothetical protein